MQIIKNHRYFAMSAKPFVVFNRIVKVSLLFQVCWILL